MDGFRHTSSTPSPRLYVAGGLVCLGIAGSMSMTFLKAEWSNVRTVGVVVALMAAGILGGLVLLYRGLVRLRRRSLLEELVLVTPRQDLRLGDDLEFTLEIKARSRLVVEAVELSLDVVESAVEGEGMAPVTHRLVERERRFKVGRELDPGEVYRVKGKFDLPRDLPATFCTEHQSVACRLQARFFGPELEGLEQTWPLQVRSRLAPGRSPERFEAASPRDPALRKSYTLSLSGAEVTVELTEGKVRDGLYVLHPGEAVAGTLECRATGSPVELPPLHVDLIFLTEGGSLDTRRVPGGVVVEGARPRKDEPVRLPFRLEVPEEGAHSYEGECLRVEWGLRVSPEDFQTASALEYLPVRVVPAPAEPES